MIENGRIGLAPMPNGNLGFALMPQGEKFLRKMGDERMAFVKTHPVLHFDTLFIFDPDVKKLRIKYDYVLN